MRKLCLTLVLVIAPLVGCEKKQEAAPAKSATTKQSTQPVTPSPKTEEGSKKDSSLAKETQKRLKTSPLKVKVQDTKEASEQDEKGENLSAELCKAACTNAVSLSLKVEKNAAVREQLQAYGLDDCQKQCGKKGTKTQVECMKKATSIKELANCSL